MTPADWASRACRDLSVDLFFPRIPHHHPAYELTVAQAVRVCRSCPAIRACREQAEQRQERHGIWGGIDFWRKPRRRQVAA